MGWQPLSYSAFDGREVIYEVSRILLHSKNLEDVFRELPSVLSRCFDFPAVAIELYDEPAGEMVFVGSVGVPQEGPETMRVPVDQTISGTVATTGKVVVETNALQRSEYKFGPLRALGAMTFVCVPIRVKQTVVGTLSLADGRRHEYVSAIIRPLQVIANDVALYIQRKKAEETLKESRAKIETILESSPNAITVTDLNGNIVQCNQATLAMHGFSSRDEVLGKSAFDFIAKGDQERAKENLKKVLDKGIVRNVEYTLLTRDGREFPGELSASLIRNPSGDPVGFIAITRDISQRKKAEEQLARYSQQLEELVEERTKQLRDAERMATIGETTTMVGHDLRNPLQAITNNLYLTKKKVESSQFEGKQDVGEMLNAIGNQLEYMNKIVSDLQDFARPMEPKRRKSDIEDLVRGILSTVAIPENVKASVTVADGFPDLVVDPDFMRRVITNMVLNALQAMPDGGELMIRVYQRKQEAIISIEDSGVGISEENLGKLFQPLYTTKSRGQGFGLPVCKRLVEAHNGFITVESREGKGTKFLVHLPLNREGLN